jgi:hypothetical protein
VQTFQRWAAEKLSGNLFDTPETEELGKVGAYFDQALFGNPLQMIAEPPVHPPVKPQSVKPEKAFDKAALKERLLSSFTPADLQELSIRERVTLLTHLLEAR